MLRKLGDGLRRKGAGVKEASKCRFDILVKSVDNVPDKFRRCRVVFERSPKVQMSKVQPVSKDKGTCAVNEHVAFVATMYRNKDNTFEKKEYDVKVQLSVKSDGAEGDMKTFARCPFDLAAYAANIEAKDAPVDLRIPIKVGKGQLIVRLAVNVAIVQARVDLDAMTDLSRMSGRVSMSSIEPEQDLSGFQDYGLDAASEPGSPASSKIRSAAVPSPEQPSSSRTTPATSPVKRPPLIARARKPEPAPAPAPPAAVDRDAGASSAADSSDDDSDDDADLLRAATAGKTLPPPAAPPAAAVPARVSKAGSAAAKPQASRDDNDEAEKSDGDSSMSEMDDDSSQAGSTASPKRRAAAEESAPPPPLPPTRVTGARAGTTASLQPEARRPLPRKALLGTGVAAQAAAAAATTTAAAATGLAASRARVRDETSSGAASPTHLGRRAAQSAGGQGDGGAAAELEQVRQELSAERKEKLSAELAMKRLQRQLDALTKERDALKADKANARPPAEATAQLRRVEAERDAALASAAAARAAAADAEALAETMQRNAEAELAKARAERDALAARYAALEGSIEGGEEMLVAALKEEIEAMNERFEEEREDLIDARDEAEASTLHLQQEVQRLDAELTALKADATRLQREKEALQNDVMQSGDQNMELSRANRMLNNELLNERQGHERMSNSSEDSSPSQRAGFVPLSDYEAVVLELTERKMALAMQEEDITVMRKDLFKERERNAQMAARITKMETQLYTPTKK